MSLLQTFFKKLFKHFIDKYKIVLHHVIQETKLLRRYRIEINKFLKIIPLTIVRV